jgi:hypothetical protein
VYECLAREFAEPQIKLSTNGGEKGIFGRAAPKHYFNLELK